MTRDKRKQQLLQAVIWTAGVILAILVYFRFLVPIEEYESMDAAEVTMSKVLGPGDVLSQSFQSVRNTIDGFEVAFGYEGTEDFDGDVLIRIFRNEELVLEQPLKVGSCPNQGFLHLDVPITHCMGDNFTLQFENGSQGEASVENTFFLMAASSEEPLSETVSCYDINGEMQDIYLLFRYEYPAGYTYYPAISAAFLVLMAALALSAAVYHKEDAGSARE